MQILNKTLIVQDPDFALKKVKSYRVTVTTCPKCNYPFYVVTYYIEWVLRHIFPLNLHLNFFPSGHPPHHSILHSIYPCSFFEYSFNSPGSVTLVINLITLLLNVSWSGLVRRDWQSTWWTGPGLWLFSRWNRIF